MGLLRAIALLPFVPNSIALTVALATGKVLDCRRNAHRLFLKRSEGPFYYWLFVAVLAALSALLFWNLLREIHP